MVFGLQSSLLSLFFSAPRMSLKKSKYVYKISIFLYFGSVYQFSDSIYTIYAYMNVLF